MASPSAKSASKTAKYGALYGATDAVERPLPDNLHPDTETHRLVGERFSEMLG